MKYRVYVVLLSLFATTHYAMAAQKPATKALTAQEKRDSDASEYMRRVAALGGDMLHRNDKEKAVESKLKITDTPTKQTDIRARL